MFARQLGDNTSWVETLPNGHQGTIRTLETMRMLARKDYQSAFVNSVVAQISNGQSPIDALFAFARDAIRYVPDPPGIELVQDFRHSTASRQGDCDDKVTWLATALLAADVSVRFVIQSYDGEFWANGWDHVYLEFYDWDRWQWRALDPTADGHAGTIRAPIGWRQELSNGYEMRFDV